MAEIHATTMAPTKHELLAGWLPEQPWYIPGAAGPDLAKAGGFRQDDPAGEVGIEFMFVLDSAAGSVVYQVPATYRDAPVDGLEHALIGTSVHGVLGRRWIYDGAHDPVLLAQLLGLLRGEVVAQAQSVSHTTDPSVSAHCTDPGQPVDLQVVRVLAPGAGTGVGWVEADWQLPDGSTARGPIAVAAAV